MSALRLDCQAFIEPGAREALIDGTRAQLVTLRLGDGPGSEHPQPAVRALLRAAEARALAFALLTLAEHAEHLTEAQR